MNLLEKCIQKSISEKLFIDFYRTYLQADRIFGIVTQNSTDFLCVKKFNEEGEYDGLTVIRKPDITLLGIGGNNRKTVEQLVLDRKDAKFESNIDLSSLKSIVESINIQFGYLSIYTEEDSDEDFYVGEIIEIDNFYLLLNAFGAEELDRSEVLIKLEAITRIEVDGKYEQEMIHTYSKT